MDRLFRSISVATTQPRRIQRKRRKFKRLCITFVYIYKVTSKFQTTLTQINTHKDIPKTHREGE